VRDTTPATYKSVNDDGEVTGTLLHRDWWAHEYQEFVFYVRTGEHSPDLSISVTLGGIGHSREFAQGAVYIAGTTFEIVEAEDFERLTADIVNFEDYRLRPERTILADLMADTTGGVTPPIVPEPDGGPGTVNWMLLPSILFAAALIIALIGVVLRKAGQRAEAKAAPKPKKINYDRKHAAVKAQPKALEYNDSSAYDLFDEDAGASTIVKYEEEPIVAIVPKAIDHADAPDAGDAQALLDKVDAHQPDIDMDEQDAIITQLDDDSTARQKHKQPTPTVTKTAPKSLQRPARPKPVDRYKDEFDD
jgi:hypothetical protein